MNCPICYDFTWGNTGKDTACDKCDDRDVTPEKVDHLARLKWDFNAPFEMATRLAHLYPEDAETIWKQLPENPR